MHQHLNLTLTKDQALILFEFLFRFNKIENKIIFEDPSEERVLWEMEGQLEKMLSESFLNNYRSILEDARSRIRNPE